MVKHAVLAVQSSEEAAVCIVLRASLLVQRVFIFAQNQLVLHFVYLFAKLFALFGYFVKSTCVQTLNHAFVKDTQLLLKELISKSFCLLLLLHG